MWNMVAYIHSSRILNDIPMLLVAGTLGGVIAPADGCAARCCRRGKKFPPARFVLRQLVRARHTLPLKADGEELVVEDLNVGYRLPLYSCQFQCIGGSGSNSRADDRAACIHHIAGGGGDATRKEVVAKICGHDMPWISLLD